MLSSRFRAGVRAGLIAAAATAGALIGFGIRHGDWMGPFTALGYQVLESFGATAPPQPLATITGLLAHASWMMVWGIAFAALAHRKALVTTVLAAVLIGLAATIAAGFVVPAALGAVRFAAMPGVQAALCIVLMTGGLVMGQALTRAD